MNNTRRPLEQRFWAKVDRSGACWVWTGSTSRRGYGKIASGGRGGKILVASRVSWELHFGPIPKGLCVLHKCDNPPCVRPDHLFLGTKKKNCADMYSKGRQSRVRASGLAHGRHTKPENNARGERNGAAKLTSRQAAEIRSLYQAGVFQKDIAVKYGTSQTNVSRIVRRAIW